MAAFASLHGVSLAQVRRLASESVTSVHAPLDKCDKHTKRPHAIPDAVKQQIDDHILLLAKE